MRYTRIVRGDWPPALHNLLLPIPRLRLSQDQPRRPYQDHPSARPARRPQHQPRRLLLQQLPFVSPFPLPTKSHTANIPQPRATSPPTANRPSKTQSTTSCISATTSTSTSPPPPSPTATRPQPTTKPTPSPTTARASAPTAPTPTSSSPTPASPGSPSGTTTKSPTIPGVRDQPTPTGKSSAREKRPLCERILSGCRFARWRWMIRYGCGAGLRWAR